MQMEMQPRGIFQWQRRNEILGIPASHLPRPKAGVVDIAGSFWRRLIRALSQL